MAWLGKAMQGKARASRTRNGPRREVYFGCEGINDDVAMLVDGAWLGIELLGLAGFCLAGLCIAVRRKARHGFENF